MDEFELQGNVGSLSALPLLGVAVIIEFSMKMSDANGSGSRARNRRALCMVQAARQPCADMGHSSRQASDDAVEKDDEVLSAADVANCALTRGGDRSRVAADKDGTDDDTDRSASLRSASSIFHM